MPTPNSERPAENPGPRGLFARLSHWMRGRRRLRHQHVELKAEFFSRRLLKGLNASPVQRERVSNLTREAVQSIQPLRGQVRALRQEALQALGAQDFDAASFERLRVAQLARVEEASRQFTDSLAAIATTLEPAQRQQLANRLASRHHTRRHHHH